MSAEAQAPSEVWVRIRMAARILDTPQSTLRRLAANGDIPARKVGRCWLLQASWLIPVSDTATPAWPPSPGHAGAGPS